jgi:hypothetical protein
MRNVTKRLTRHAEIEHHTLRQTHRLDFPPQTKTGANGGNNGQRIPAPDSVTNDLMIRRIMAELLTME